VFVYFLGVLVRACFVLRALFYPCGPGNVLRFLFYVLVLFVALWIYLSSFLGRKSSISFR